MTQANSELQVDFYYRLKEIKKSILRESMSRTIKEIPLKTIDSELNKYAPKGVLSKIASFGLRGEVFLPVPCILKKNPKLIAYYRLLYGVSQKEFYKSENFGKYKTYEVSNGDFQVADSDAIELSKKLIQIGRELVEGIDSLSIETIQELQILTLGAQFRGSRNTDLGKEATKKTFSLIKKIVKSYIKNSNKSSIRIINDSKREVVINFSSDPDIVIVETLKNMTRPLVSIEIKGGTDYSNIHNRIGEAEKSHQKAKSKGFYEFWTIIRVDMDLQQAHRESPTTSRFFHLDHLLDENSKERLEFKELLSSLLSIDI
jgi:hypothetical protein